MFLYMFEKQGIKNPQFLEDIFCGCYHLASQSDQDFFENIEEMLDKYSKHFDKFILAQDFSFEESELCLSQFFYEYNAKNIVKLNTCFKKALNTSCVDFFITNSPLSFKNTVANSKRLFGFHKMVITVMKTTFKKLSRNTVKTRNTLIRPNLSMT